ncbi:MAG: magnesium/cobalt transporter CorA [Syntrophales bacterium]|nr:magnesium/cobalt transporter CorA [Syntrophales bacterium]MDD4338196.1 magnesium/cobalt transporter CorA [Syntrophales bacterium]HOG07936.1 magnesium/cobalt transporter CorA [Syntrophales bacterium]HPB70283.1 magnesium/cobalt transporter CorA [Syntrophales bacterium]HQN25530.1 magnesium/cobalt transporter CorA [Syntrophales bacterium]
MSSPQPTRVGKVGLPPGSLVHVGRRLTEKTCLTLFNFDEQHIEERTIAAVGDAVPYRNRPSVTWLNIDGLHDTGVLAALGEAFGLHPLVLEDMLNTEQRPKFEDLGDYLFIVMRVFMLPANPEGGIRSEQISLVIGPHFLITLQEKAGPLLDPIREGLRAGKGRIRKGGADYLAHAIVDAVVDQYFVVLEALGERIEVLEDRLMTRPTPDTLRAIQGLKREITSLRRSVWPLREAISAVDRSDSTLLHEGTGIYFRDVYDHTIQMIDTIETFRDQLAGMLDIYLSSLSNRMNEVMRVLTIIATLFMPLTFIVGIYGMNFKYMPELAWRWGYLYVWGVILLAVAAMLLYFRRKRWLP